MVTKCSRSFSRFRAAGDPALAAERDAVARALADGTRRVVQIPARRA
jgi:hypothetical protein